MLLPEGLVLLVLRPCRRLVVRAMVLLAFAGGGGGVCPFPAVTLLPLLTTEKTGPLDDSAAFDFHLLAPVVVAMLGMGPACSAAVAGLMLNTGVAAGWPFWAGRPCCCCSETVPGVWKAEGVRGMPDGPVRGVVWGAVAPAAVVLAAGGVLLTVLCLPMPMREVGRVACMVIVRENLLARALHRALAWDGSRSRVGIGRCSAPAEPLSVLHGPIKPKPIRMQAYTRALSCIRRPSCRRVRCFQTCYDRTYDKLEGVTVAHDNMSILGSVVDQSDKRPSLSNMTYQG
jgi:hypothetical protein